MHGPGDGTSPCQGMPVAHPQVSTDANNFVFFILDPDSTGFHLSLELHSRAQSPVAEARALMSLLGHGAQLWESDEWAIGWLQV